MSDRYKVTFIFDNEMHAKDLQRRSEIMLEDGRREGMDVALVYLAMKRARAVKFSTPSRRSK